MVKKLYEKDIQSAIIQYLRLKRFVVFKHHSTGFTIANGKARTFRYGDKGISDIIACDPTGRFWAIEVKRKYGKPTEDQLVFIASVNANGGKGIVAYSVDDIIREVEDAAKVPVVQVRSDKPQKVGISP